ncbi:MAG: SHOCT domain-containing protein [Acidimicrobiia bacterium]
MDEPSTTTERTLTFWNLFFILLIYIPLIMLWVFTLLDLTKRDNLSGAAKALWAITIVLLPLIGMVIYFIARPPSPMEEAMRSVPPASTVASSYADQVEKFATLRDAGAINQEEYEAFKAKLLS